MKAPMQAIRDAAESLDAPVHRALKAGAQAAHDLGRATHDAAIDTAHSILSVEKKLAGNARVATRGVSSYVRKHPVQALVWFAAGAALVGGLTRLARR